MFISNNTYTVLCAIPFAQTLVGIPSALINSALLIRDLWTNCFGDPSDINSPIQNKIDNINQQIADHITAIENGLPLGIPLEERKDSLVNLYSNIQSLEWKRYSPRKHFQEVVDGILSAIPVVGTIYNLPAAIKIVCC